MSRPADAQLAGTIVWVHAFAEEMNKTRRMSACMARSFAGRGFRVVQRDLHGCGDSAGDFADASWDVWIEDIEAELRAADPERPVWLWCVRAGALLASAVLSRHPGVNLLLWQPVLSGAQHLQQFLRLHTGARVLGSAKGCADVPPAEALRNGTATELGGYLLAPTMAQALGRAAFVVPEDFAGRIAWFELRQDEEPSVSAAAAKHGERLKAKGLHLEIEALTGPAFWQTQEIEQSDVLLCRSLAAVVAQAPAASPGRLAVGRADPSPGDTSTLERPLAFRCGDAQIWGVLAGSAQPASTAVLIAVGGPQYRVGSHRQFVLLARRLAASGFPTLRFDYRGMGDSEGDATTFENVGPDLHAAIDALLQACPAAQRVVVWGLCDAASAALMHAGAHPAVSGIVAVNPWARSQNSLAATQVRHYYLARLRQRDFWIGLVRGRLDIRASAIALLKNLEQAWSHLRSLRAVGSGDDSFQSRMARGMAGFRGRVLLLVAENDLTAREFLQHAAGSSAWRGLLGSSRVTRADVPLADHTFSCAAWRRQAEDATLDWLGDDRRPTSA